MPAFNAEKYIKRAIQSVISQTFEGWELIIVDDGSTDSTAKIITEYSKKYNSIFYYRIDNTGSAKIPRDCAIYHAKNRYVLFLDSDDYLEQNYLQKVWKRHIETNADVVLGKMCVLDSKSMTIANILPSSDYDYQNIYDGKDLVKDTLNTWKIGFNGALIDKAYLEYRLSYPKQKCDVWMNSDEVDSRYVLLQNPKVGFADAIYYYWLTSQSVSRNINIKQFHYICTEIELHKLIYKSFDDNSIEIALLNKQHSAIIRRASLLLSYYGNMFSENEKKWIRDNLKVLAKLTNHNKIKLFINNLCYYIALKGYSLNKYIHIKRKIKRIKYIFENNEDKAFNNTRIKREQFIRLHLKPHYNMELKNNTDKTKPYVISMNNGFVEGGGLADRLRGIVSTYMVAKELMREFKIQFTYPFDLSLFLIPNKVNWLIDKDEILYNDTHSKVVVLDSVISTKEHSRRQKEWIISELKQNRDHQTHVYTNAFFSYYDNYCKCFNELFKPSCRLQAAIDSQLEILGNDYISVSLRFLNLFNDFNETHGLDTEKYTEKFRNQIRNRCLNKIKELHEKHPSQKILVNSDSSTFLSYAVEMDFVYVIPGTITHIDAETGGSYEAFEKTFLDFLMIANASHIYLLQTPPMHKSGYPYAASFVYQKPFEIIKF